MKLFLALIISSIFLLSWHMPNAGQAGPGPVKVQVRGGLPVFYKKLKQGKPVVIAYLGGSITEAPGYRVQTEQYFKDTYPASHITAINAGVGGTGSYLGVFRLGQDVLSHHPDLVFVEFAVNDAKVDSLKVGTAIEGIIRQIKKADKHTDICFLYTIYQPMIADYEAGNIPASVRYIDHVATHYNLPAINLAPDVLAKLHSGELIFKADKDFKDGQKIIFTNDATHPTTEGHKVYTQTIVSALKQIQQVKGEHRKLAENMYPNNLQYTTMQSPAIAQKYGNWQSGNTLPELKSFMKAFPGLLYTSNPNDSLVVKFSGSRIGFGDVVGPSAGGAVINVDGKIYKRQRFDEFSSYYRRSFFFIDSLSAGPHTLSIKLDTTHFDKLKMLRTTNTGDVQRYSRYELYIGNIMLEKKH